MLFGIVYILALILQLIPLYAVVGAGILMAGSYVVRLALGNTVV